MDIKEEALKMHSDKKGKLEVIGKVHVKDRHDLAVAYTPGVAEPCIEISKDRNKVYEYTIKGNTVGVVTNGTAVLGLGNIGASAGLPVMEGKALLFKEFAGIDAFPICLDTEDPEEIIKTVKLMEPVFGGINLEDIKAPECFYIEKRLKEELDIPVFHDDQHGTAIVVLAGLYNALKLVNKKLEESRIVINGAGSAGIAICKLLLNAGAKNVVMCDINGALVEGDERLNPAQREIAKVTNRELQEGTLKDIVKNKDAFVGVSAPKVLTKEMVATMNKDSIVFAMANPTPEIMPDEAKEGGARIVATGRSDFPNQINNVLVFPGIFRGALDVRAKEINEDMKLAAARGIANLIKDEELKEDYIIPDPFNKEVCESVAKEVRRIAKELGVAKI
ncbi:malate dehydrogenase (oxaloacetate-decarboxylating) [Clostridium tetanomorphum]|uniref:NAD-dependent malic enzyme n=1 Tax=Clostridium tetanomorphum TaxID=1553 RepID=A0A923ECI1_CLOTT|nr:malic enzyme-like NAD(P)-binding protein [Clostridium tetanomorphum]KAJ50419.1 NAD-dependent malic enzyme [Clostridium tetanomorphum DSM 665]MBC2399427.1 NAD-dependent malic enzyme [Clostridium tetanomorphum]MBP1865766.1 malate dehydrogenase (oxaloacetate-decarboxylating) [Clostridium tetanomorphum]NRS86888.1 malate dehydrogenase (oxaloacetate-decarboxylating) [Clostridium tetanomorphum]NRZ99356.1 malate dehydrogenase (oxaloacetate-decarboxylating) [Clostridium tetanomorphum]